MELVCIVCPRGCRISIDNGVVKGNSCKRGEEFAINESTCPKRSVCTTVATSFENMPVLPVRTDGEIEKSQIKEFMNIVSTVKVTKPVKMGDVVIENVLNSGVNVIATSSIVQ